MVTNGRIAITQLTNVAANCSLYNPAAVAFKLAQHIGKLESVQITPAGYGAGYRDYACQVVFFRASQGDKTAMAQAGLNPDSKVVVASPGYSSHGTGTRIDLLFNGSSNPNSEQLSLMGRYGFTREFGADDPNHFKWNGKQAPIATSDKTRIIAHYLNSRKLGPSTDAVKDGKPDKNFIQLLQTAGHADGLYRVPPYVIDGDWEPVARTRTRNVLYPHYWGVAWHS